MSAERSAARALPRRQTPVGAAGVPDIDSLSVRTHADGGPFTPRLVSVSEVDEPPDRWALENELSYRRPADPDAGRAASELYVISAGFATDFASIPRALAWAVPRYGQHTKAAIVHDCLCVSEFDRFRADEVFRDALRGSFVGVGRRWLMWAGVTWGSVYAALRAISKRRPSIPAERSPRSACLKQPTQVDADSENERYGIEQAVVAGRPHRIDSRALAAARAAVVGVLTLYGMISLFHLDPIPTAQWLERPGHSDLKLALVSLGLLGVLAAGLLVTCAAALKRWDLLASGKFFGCWCITMACAPLLPVALAAGLVILPYKWPGEPILWVLFDGRRKPSGPAKDLRIERLEQARDNFVR